jgi:hypothetical protein
MGYLKELQRVNDEQSEYVCRACGWQGVRKRPSNKFKWVGF